jgi:hypothetical protein
MARSHYIIALIEGFKLGSLGVSHKPKVTIEVPAQEPEEAKPTGPVEIPQDMGYKVIGETWVDTPKDFTMDWIDAVKWIEKTASDSTRYKLFMKCRRLGSRRYWIDVFGGPKMTTTFAPIPKAAGFDFEAHCVFKFSSDRAAGLYIRSLMNDISQAGSFGYTLATGQLEGKGKWFFTILSKEKQYLQDTCGISKSEYFSKR